jgi:hypothetical protein
MYLSVKCLAFSNMVDKYDFNVFQKSYYKLIFFVPDQKRKTVSNNIVVLDM